MKWWTVEPCTGKNPRLLELYLICTTEGIYCAMCLTVTCFICRVQRLLLTCWRKVQPCVWLNLITTWLTILYAVTSTCSKIWFWYLKLLCLLFLIIFFFWNASRDLQVLLEHFLRIMLYEVYISSEWKTLNFVIQYYVISCLSNQVVCLAGQVLDSFRYVFHGNSMARNRMFGHW